MSAAFEKSLACPTCQATVSRAGDAFVCQQCDASFAVTDNQMAFVPESQILRVPRDSKYQLKKLLRRSSTLWWFVKLVFSTSLIVVNQPKKLLSFISDTGLVLNLGSGSTKLGDNVVNIDIQDYEEVDVIGNIHHLPFADNSFEGAICAATLEHCREPAVIVSEAHRVVKPGGYIYISVPFVFEFHSSPDDFYRWTIEGLRELLKEWEVVECGPCVGPISAWYGITRSCLALALSFGSKPLYTFWTFVIALFMWPIKLLDLIFIHCSMAHYVMACGYVIARKRSSEETTAE